RDDFGRDVAVMGNDLVVIGARSARYSAPYPAGAAYLFSSAGTLLTTFTNPVPGSPGMFGGGLTAAGSGLLIGASLNDIGATGAGAAYLYSTGGVLLTSY